jgi:hypothetical protein
MLVLGIGQIIRSSDWAKRRFIKGDRDLIVILRLAILA